MTASRFQRTLSGLFAAGALAVILTGGTLNTAHARPARFEFYDVQPGDTWERIAAAYATPVSTLFLVNGVVNPGMLAPGQRLFIPTSYHGLKALPLETTSGDNPWDAALAGNTQLTAILLVNDLVHGQAEEMVFAFKPGTPIGPSAQAVGPTNPTPLPGLELPAYSPPVPAHEIAPGPPITRARMGVQGFFQLEPDQIDAWLNAAESAGFSWVKYQVNWKEHESPQGHYPMLPTLDAFFDLAQRRNLNVLLSIAKAPEWARATTEGDGPPSSYNDLASFAGFLANHYRGRLDHIQVAIEVWNEPNTRREWNGGQLSPQDYTTLLATGYNAIKAQDSRFIVISAGLAPTGVNDGVIALDDRAYFAAMLQAGAAQYSDAIGIHPYGWANPPAIRCCNSILGPPSFNDNPRFFFLNTVEDYRAIQTQYGVANKPLWATEFGWGTADHVGGPPPEMAYFASTNSDQQALYIVDAYRWAQDQDYMGPMFLWNLNMAAYFLSDPDQSAYSIMFGLDSPLQAYNLIRNTAKK